MAIRVHEQGVITGCRTVYAGISSATGKAMYRKPTDAPQGVGFRREAEPKLCARRERWTAAIGEPSDPCGRRENTIDEGDVDDDAIELEERLMRTDCAADGARSGRFGRVGSRA